MTENVIIQTVYFLRATEMSLLKTRHIYLEDSVKEESKIYCTPFWAIMLKFLKIPMIEELALEKFKDFV